MKKIMLFTFLFSFIILFVFASVSACQYKDTEPYQEFGTWLYYNDSGEFFGDSLYSFDYLGGYGNLDGPCPYSFKVKNPFSYEISLTVIYRVYAPALQYFHGEVNEERQESLTLKEYSEGKISGTSVGVGGCGVIQNETAYIITSPNVLISKKGYITKQREICRICPNGRQCLDDGSSCNSKSDCGSNMCNINKKCGVIGSPFLVSCSDGKMNCNNQDCLTPAVKRSEESYSCEWECAPGTIACNGICRTVSVKNLSQEYYCKEECISQAGDGKVCVKNGEQLKQDADRRKRNWIIFGIIAIIFTSIGVWFFAIEKRGRVKQESEALKSKVKDLKTEENNLENSIRVSNEKIRELEIEKEKRKIEIADLQEMIKSSKGEAKQKYEKALLRLREKNTETENKLKIQRNRLIEEETALGKEEAELLIKKERLNTESFEAYRDEQLSIYQRKYDRAGIDISYDPKQKYFVVTYRKSKKQTSLQRYVYSSYFNLSENREVHHIDFDPLNNEIWNLIALPFGEHKRFNHGRVIEKDWVLGIEELKKQLEMKDTDFHKYIQEHLKEVGYKE